MIRRLTTSLLCLALAAGLFGVLPAGAAPAAPLTAISLTGGTYAQDFDTLANSGTSSTTPDGWTLSESGSNANGIYTAGTGSGTTGDTYSFGATSSTERAFGGLLSGSLIPTIGVEFQNITGDAIISLAVSYNCEQWRLGATGRTDRLDFQYSTDATSLTTGTWTDVDSLDCSSTVTTGTPGALNGNDVANRNAVSGSVPGLSIADGTVFWIRWLDFNASGSDDGLAVDDFSLTPEIPTAVTLTSFAAEALADRVMVTWETVSELTNAGFNLYRSDSAAGPQTLLATVPSQAPGSAQGYAYSFDDLDVQTGQTWWYWLEDVSLSGATTLHGPVSATVQTPTAVTLSSVSVGAEAATALPWLWIVIGVSTVLGVNWFRRRA